MDLEQPSKRAELSEILSKQYEEQSVAEFDDGHRNHLGASVIGQACKRKGWLTFRWAKKEQFSGRMLRLFNRGHLEEARFVKILTRMGFEVSEINPETGKQYRIVGCHGHFGGSTDGIAIAPSWMGLTEKLICEFKTHNDKSFGKLKKAGSVKKAKPDHYAQMSTYGKGFSLQYGIYIAVNKNTDEVYIEVVKLDWTLADVLYGKACDIIYSQQPPDKISEHPSYSGVNFEGCKWCHFASICHYNGDPEKNCRSCDNAFPAEEGKWYCRVNDGLIPNNVISNGCESWRRII